MNKVEKQYKAYMEKNLKINDRYDQIAKKIDFNLERKPMKKRNLFALCGASLAAVVIIGVAGFALLNNNKAPQVKPKALVSVDVNPSIELVVDENNKVISVTGKNDDGIMILYGEVVIGKTLDEALELIISLENEAGFLLSGEVGVNANNIQISVNGDTQEIYNTIKTNITTKINSICDELNITPSIEEANKYANEKLNQLILDIDPLLEETLSSMTMEEKLSVISNHQKETSEIYSAQLQDFYNNVKNTEISFVEKEEIQEVLNGVESTYQQIVATYKGFVQNLGEQKTVIEELRYELLVKEDSLFQQALNTVIQMKDEVNELKVKLSESDNAIEKMMIKTQLEIQEPLLVAAEEALINAGNLANKALDDAKAIIDQIVVQLKELEKEFPTEIKSLIENKAKDIENKVNEAKDSYFEEFEDKYQEELLKAKEEIKARKEALTK
ncbi:MAG: hypothetical protein E7180_01935 [Erysipelotrichaceae bacterium]|nr:hypothetical protein [Erysipelotrichaceae bacterium]